MQFRAKAWHSLHAPLGRAGPPSCPVIRHLTDLSRRATRSCFDDIWFLNDALSKGSTFVRLSDAHLHEIESLLFAPRSHPNAL